jgi:PAS domain S-box-containing protein
MRRLPDAPAMMPAAPLLHRQEVLRLRKLESVAVLDTGPEPAYDALVRCAAQLAGAGGARLHLVTARHLWPKAVHGVAAATLPRPGSACAEVVATDAALLRTEALPAGSEAPPWPAYAGVPVHVDGLPVGTLSVVDARARPDWHGGLVERLRDLALLASALLQGRKAQRKAELRQQRLRDASRAGADWLWETDAEGVLTWVSDDTALHLGLEAESLLGLPLHALHRPREDETRARWDGFEQAWAQRRAFDDAVGDTDTPRGRVAVTFGGAPTFDFNGHFAGYRGSGRVVTETLAAQLAARRADALLRAALEGLPAGVAVSDPAGRIVLANQHWVALLAAAQTLPGPLTWPSLERQLAYAGHYPDAVGREEEFLDWRLGLVAEQPLARELRWGAEGWRLVSDRRLPDGHVVHLCVDRTDRKQAERTLAALQRRQLESDAQLAAVLAALPDLWFVVDAQGRHARVGAPRHPLLPLPYEELAGRPFEHGLPPGLAARAQEAMQRARSLGRVQRLEYTLAVADGGERPVEARISPMPGGELLYLVRDLSERQQAEQARQDKLVAELASRSKTAFMSRMSHEMRTPLNAIIGFAQLLRLRAGARIDHVDHILNAGRHLLSLVNDVLDLQRIEADELGLQPRAVALAPLIDDCLAMLGPLAEARAVHQRSDLADPALHVLADAQRLRQVLLNIGSNAVKYNRPAGRVCWSVRAGGDGRVVVCVADSGAGMTAEQIGRLFQPFERLGRETSSIEGSGLGLVISRRLVEAMQGRLTIASEAGVGTQVCIELPATPAEPPPAVAALPSRPLPLSPAPLRLLYVEDNRINALLFEEALRPHAGFELRVAEDGREALEIVEGWLPDVLVLDAHLPGDSGHQVLRRLRERPALRAAPAYMCSADAMPEDVQRALDAGFCGYWIKPLDIDAVLDELHALRAQLAAGR